MEAFSERRICGATSVYNRGCSAVLAFNDGTSGLVKVFENLNIGLGKFAAPFLQSTDFQRDVRANRKSEEGLKSRRKQLRKKTKGFQDRCDEMEGVTYSTGGF